MRELGDVITLVMGAGGVETQKLVTSLISDVIRRRLGPLGLDDFDDSAVVEFGEFKVAITVDSYTIKPAFFPGGDIGKLAISGTINDLVAVGARPVAVLDSIVVEEGFSLGDLARIMKSIQDIANRYNIALLGGDFKVMPKGSLDGVIVTMVGLGVCEVGPLSDSNVKVGDKIVVTGPVGDHGAMVLAHQLGMLGEVDISSDCRPLYELIDVMKKVGGVHACKDPTRGGLAMALNEFARKSNVCIVIYEEHVPVRDSVRSLAELTGVDYLELACEGQMVISVDAEFADELVEELRRYGFSEASVIGEVREEPRGTVLLRTSIGSTRILQPPIGAPIPRIC